MVAVAMSERSLMDTLDALSEQLKTSTKDITAALESFKIEIGKMPLGYLKEVVSTLTKLDGDIVDLSTTLKTVLAIEVIPKKVTSKK